MAARIFDDCGNGWSGGSDEFRRAFAPARSQWATGEYVARVLGFVVVDRFGDSIQLRLAPSVVSEKALVHAFEWISSLKFERISLGLFSTGWTYSLCRTCDQAKAKIAAAIGDTHVGILPVLVSRAVSANELEAGPAFRDILVDWKKIRASSSDLAVQQLVEQHFGSRYAISEPVADGNRLIFSSIGSGFNYYGPDWARAAVGQPVQSQPDATYGAWAAETYVSAAKTMEPQVYDVDAMITSKSGTRARLRIRRAVLPLCTASGSRIIIGGSQYVDTIDLRSPVESGLVLGLSDNLDDLDIARGRLSNSRRYRGMQRAAAD